MHRRALITAVVAVCLLAAHRTRAQERGISAERGAVALGELVRGLSVNTRVLVIGAHPDDEDTQLITWLARGRQVETAYLSLTRGDGGQNLIGNELGEALGAIRTEELLAARRIDGGQQYFTRAYDFGFSKTAAETYKHWPKDSILRDVVTVVRDFRPHVIVAVFTGTPRDGHGHHQVSGLLAREAFDLAGDGVKMPRGVTHGRAPWTPVKFYRRVRANEDTPALRFDVGEYSPLRGRSYAEIAAESRSQHKSQAFGVLQRKGAIVDAVRLEASRVGTPGAGYAESSLFDGIDTTWARASSNAHGTSRAALDSISAAIVAVQRTYDPFTPEQMLRPLDRVRRLARRVIESITCEPGDSTDRTCAPSTDDVGRSDLERSLVNLEARVKRAILLASGLGIDATVNHETWAESEPIVPTVAVYNRAGRPLTVTVGYDAPKTGQAKRREVASRASVVVTDTVMRAGVTSPWWLERPRRGDLFSVPIGGRPESTQPSLTASVVAIVDDVAIEADAPIVYRYAHPIEGEVQRPIAIVPALSITVDQATQYVPANRPIDRTIRVTLRSASNHARAARVSLRLPSGLTADSVSRTVGVPDYAGNFGAEGAAPGTSGGRVVPGLNAARVVEFRVRGVLPEGRHIIEAVAESEGQQFTSGYVLVDYDHIRPQRLFRPASLSLSAVTVSVPPGLTTAYIPGVGDNVAPMLQQLGIPLTIIAPEHVADADLSRFTSIVVGPRAYESSPALVAANARLLDFARNGGTLVVQYGQYEMTNLGLMPYPITLAQPADRVTEEDAAVRVVDAISPLLVAPNRIGVADWRDWVQERALYMPRSHDEHYRPLLSMNDTGEQPNDGALLVAPLGKGTYVYTTLALFRQLPAGVAGAARLFVNLLSADQRAAGSPQAPTRP